MSRVVPFVRRVVRIGRRVLAPPPVVAAGRRLKSTAERVPRHAPGTIRALDYVLEYSDLLSICPQWEDIFVAERLRFRAPTAAPRVFDCGANIGLASLYFKKLYPRARITAFEADPRIAAMAVRNFEANGASDVELIPSAVWTSNTTVRFLREGSDSGSIDCVAGRLQGTAIEVPAIRLRDRLEAESRIDLLKLDIEGAELSVLTDLGSTVSRVDRLVVEVHEFDPARRILSDVLGLVTRAGFDYALDNFAALPWREPVTGDDAPFPRQPLCWAITVKAWRREMSR